MSKIHGHVSIKILAAPESVFAVLSDPTRMSEWINGVQSAEWDGNSELRAGSRFNMSYKYGRKVADITMEILAVEPHTLLEYKTVKGPYPILARFTLRPSDDGTTVTYSQTAYSDSILSALGFAVTGWFAKSMVRRILRKDLEKLDAMIDPKKPQD